MKFKVSKTSVYGNDEQPCKDSFKEKYTSIDERSVDDPKKNKYIRDWYEYGTNHRVENGHIKRDFEEEGWFVEISTLSQLLEFENENGEIIIKKSTDNSAIHEIEIYDDYRE